VRVARGGKLQGLLQCDLPGRAVEQIRAAHDMRDTLQCIINHDRELVGESAVTTADDHIPALAQPKVAASLQAVLDRDHDVLGPARQVPG